MKFQQGQRVRLLPFEETDQPEQFGEILEDEDNGTYCIQLDDKYLEDEFDDGIREVPIDQIEAAT